MKKIINTAVRSSKHSKPIVTDVFYTKTEKKKPIVIFCHGYKGYKDWGAWNLTVPKFVDKNLFFVKFNFSHNGGTLENPIDFPDLEAFGNNNFILELDDLDDIINWVLKNAEFKDEIDENNIILIGHSRGGGIVTIKASENSKIKKVITWAGVSDFGKRFPTGKQLEAWRNHGVSYVLNSRTNQQMPHTFAFYENFMAYEERLTIKNAAKKLKIPHLILHGSMDDVVLPKEAENIHSWSPQSELIIIEGMNHPLGCSQPYTNKEMPEHLKLVVQKSIEFILAGTHVIL